MTKFPATLTGVLNVGEAGTPEHPIAEPPLEIWPSPGHPAHPIVPPQGPVDPGYGFPLPPVVSHPIVPPPPYPSQGPGFPTHPIAPPTYPVDPSYGVPVPPTVWPQPPRPVDPEYSVPIRPYPEHPIYFPPPAPNNDLPVPPGGVYPPLPPYVDGGPLGQVMCFVWIPGIGYRWTTIDVNLKPTHPIVLPPSTVPGVPEHPMAPGGGPAHPIAPTPSPR